MVGQQRSTVVLNSQRDSRAVGTAIAELAEAHDYARDARCDPWQFAVEIARLQELGLTYSDLRWLVEKGYAVHAREVTRSADQDRKFALGVNTIFSPDTRFVLTDAGLDLAGGDRPEPTLIRLTPQPSSMPPMPVVSAAPNTPNWDGNMGVLYFAGRIVKRFSRAARNQEIILGAFEEEGWPYRIDDPLPPSGNVEPKRRLHDTIKWLNRDHEAHVIAFIGDGTGEGVRWRSLVSSALPIPRNSSGLLRRAA